MKEVLKLSMKRLLEGFKKREFSVQEVTKITLDNIQEKKELNAYITICEELALKSAEQSDLRYKSASQKPLDGVPFAIKDLFCTKGILTTAASKILSNFVPPYESHVSQNLLNDGIVLLGKTNMDEFAMGSTNVHSYYGAVRNPWKRKSDDVPLVPGGSSGGSAAAVSGYLCYGAIASDTGGSIRQPASFCGIVGVKPTYGRCSRYGMVAFASSLDQAGPLARTVEDCALILQSISGYDERDATSSSASVPNFKSFIGNSAHGLRIGIPKEYRMDGTPKKILEIWDKGIEILKEAGCSIHEVSLPHTKYALPVYYMIATAEASSNLARFDGIRYGYRAEGKTLEEIYENSRGSGFGKEVLRRILTGTYVLSSRHLDDYYIKARKVQKLIQNDFTNAFKEIDLMLTPTTPSAAFPIDNNLANVKDPVSEYLNDIFTVTVNLSGIPAISIPAGYDTEGLPLGLQLIAPNFREDLLFSVGSILEKNSGFVALGDQYEI